MGGGKIERKHSNRGRGSRVKREGWGSKMNKEAECKRELERGGARQVVEKQRLSDANTEGRRLMV